MSGPAAQQTTEEGLPMKNTSRQQAVTPMLCGRGRPGVVEPLRLAMAAVTLIEDFGCDCNRTLTTSSGVTEVSCISYVIEVED